MDAGMAGCTRCTTTVRVGRGLPEWSTGDEDTRELALEAKKRAESIPLAEVFPPVSDVRGGTPAFTAPAPAAKPKLARKPKSFVREARSTPATRAGFRESAEPERSVELAWRSTRRRETTSADRAVLAALVIIPALFAMAATQSFVWAFVAAFVGFAIAAWRQRPERLDERRVEIREHEIRVGELVVPRVRVEGVEVRSSKEEGLHRVVLRGTNVVVDETSKLEHAHWVEEELKRSLAELAEELSE